MNGENAHWEHGGGGVRVLCVPASLNCPVAPGTCTPLRAGPEAQPKGP